MRDHHLSAFVFGVVASFSPGAVGARVCGGRATPSSGNFQYRIGDVRFDSADPSTSGGLATIAASLSTSTTPLYECVAQWPESWGGWYQGGSQIIWSDCIWTGAGAGADKTVSFAVDWKNKTMYLSHTFACSDELGSDGLATGSVNLDFNCTTADGDRYCTPQSTSAGARPSLHISTALHPAPLNLSSGCADNSKVYQSWRLGNWLRDYRLAPGSKGPPSSDTGPSFTLTNMANNGVFNCTTSAQKNGMFEGSCKSSTTSSSATTADFRFDSALDMLTVSQHWGDCGGSAPLEAVGVEYMQAACERSYNSDKFTCTSDPVWIGTATV